MNAVVYCRVSSKQQVSNLSLETQEEECRRYCERENYDVDAVFVEEGESAKTADRTQLKALLKYCARHRAKIDVVVLYSLDRFSRNVKDFLNLTEELKSLHIALACVSQTVDQETP